MNSRNVFSAFGVSTLPENPDRFAIISASKCAFCSVAPLPAPSDGSAVSILRENRSGVTRSHISAAKSIVFPLFMTSGPYIISPFFASRSTARVVPTTAP